MGFLDRVLPWKHKDDLGLNDNLGLPPQGAGIPGMGAVPDSGNPMAFPGSQGQGLPLEERHPQTGMGQQFNPYQQPQQPPQIDAFQNNRAYEQSNAAEKEVEVISAKLDAIKSTLDAMNQRLAIIERNVQVEQGFRKQEGWR
jgi:hypothetical protein